MASSNNDKIEAVLFIAVLLCMTFLTYTGKIDADTFKTIISAIIGYAFGRIINHKTGAEP